MKKQHMVYTAVALTVVSVLSAFGFYHYTRAQRLEAAMQNNYQRAFFDMVQYVDEMESSLAKSVLAVDSKQMVKLSSDIYRYCLGARNNLGQLPLENTHLENTAKFLAQVGDYTYNLSLRHLDNSPVESEERSRLLSFVGYAQTLGQSLNAMQEDLFAGEAAFAETPALMPVSEGFDTVEQGFQDYPSLVYDGPFSDHLEAETPKALEGLAACSEEEAGRLAASVLGDGVQAAEPEEGNIPAYRFVTETCSCEVTKQGGRLLSFLNSRQIGDGTLDINGARPRAEAFLQQMGYTNMRETYYELQSGIITINYAYDQKGVLMYPDLVKVRLATDNGEVIGLEASGYLAHHRENRPLATPRLSAQEAQAMVDGLLAVEKVSEAVIAAPGMPEQYCYEIKGRFQGRLYLIYINAETGVQEDILLLTESENGTLAV